MRYLLDTNVCITALRKKFNYREIIRKIIKEDCYISELTLYELKVGDALGQKDQQNYKSQGLQYLINLLNIIPIGNVIDFAASEKARLQFAGTPIDDDFDLIIGCTSVKYGMTMVTENTRHFKNIKGIKLENWVER